MNISIEFISNIPLARVKQDSLDYFLNQGFKLTRMDTDILEFKRGSLTYNMITFNPLKWKSYIKLIIKEHSVIAKFDIDTTHQAVTLEEEKLWETFMANYQETIQNQKSVAYKNKVALRLTKNSSLKYVGYAILGAAVFGIPAGFIAYLTGFANMVPFAAVSGALVFLSYFISKKKKQ